MDQEEIETENELLLIDVDMAGECLGELSEMLEARNYKKAKEALEGLLDMYYEIEDRLDRLLV